MTLFAPHPSSQSFSTPINGRQEHSWAPVSLPDVVEGYQVSTQGEVLSYTGSPIKPGTAGGLQRWITFRRSNGAGSKAFRLDRLVLISFVGPALPGQEPLHLDGDVDNCALSNLVWSDDVPRARSLTGRKSRAKTTPRIKKPAPARSASQIVVTRTYSMGDVKLTVGEDGALLSISPTGKLTPTQTNALAQLMARVHEMNTLLGVK